MQTLNNSILLVEDEVDVAEIIRDYLQQADYSVKLAHSGAGIVELVKKSPPQLLLLDIMLPEVDGVTICREIRSFSKIPIIMLTAKVSEIDRLLGYELGADDYICKPVNPREILARVKTILRLYRHVPTSDYQLLELDEAQLLATYHGSKLKLTKTEFRLLKLLYENKGKVLSRKNIREKIYSEQSEASDRAIDTCVKKLRKKMTEVTDEDNPLHSIYGLGYKYESIE